MNIISHCYYSKILDTCTQNVYITYFSLVCVFFSKLSPSCILNGSFLNGLECNSRRRLFHVTSSASGTELNHEKSRSWKSTHVPPEHEIEPIYRDVPYMKMTQRSILLPQNLIVVNLVSKHLAVYLNEGSLPCSQQAITESNLESSESISGPSHFILSLVLL